MTEVDWAAVYEAVAPHVLSAGDVQLWRVGGAVCVALAVLIGGIASVVNWRAAPPGVSKLPGQLVLLPAGIVAAYGLWTMLAPSPDLDPFLVRGRCTAIQELGHGAVAATVEVQDAVEVTPTGPGPARSEYREQVSLRLEGSLEGQVTPGQEVALLCHKSDACIGLIEQGAPRL